jgi:hypothetical protein
LIFAAKSKGNHFSPHHPRWLALLDAADLELIDYGVVAGSHADDPPNVQKRS